MPFEGGSSAKTLDCKYIYPPIPDKDNSLYGTVDSEGNIVAFYISG